MGLPHLFILMGAGLTAGFLSGLLGVGGGIIFAPVLFFYFQAIGISSAAIAPLTIGTSLFCTTISALVSGWSQYRRSAVVTRTALSVGVFSALAVFLVTRFVTTQPWYDGRAFQIVFSLILLVVVTRMLIAPRERDHLVAANPQDASHSWPALAGAGTMAGAVASAVGVGGGIVLVPAYSHFLRYPIHIAVGTSSVTVVLISFVGVVSYVFEGWGQEVTTSSVGYVDVIKALILSAPAVLTARAGVHVAHRINRKALRLSFSVIAAIVAVRLLIRALG